MIQKDALDLLKIGGNTLITGAAGSGKTYLLNQYIKYLTEHGVNVAITASTGIAATHIGGQTIHSWSGIGISEYLNEEDIQKIATNKNIKSRFKKTKVLIIDEISMLHGRQLDMIDQIARAMLDHTKPFGGIQVVLCGDFFQLPPITKNNNFNQDNGNKFAYQCLAWENGQFNICYLHEQFRQKEGKNGEQDELLKILNEIRSGSAGENTKVPLRSRYKKDPDTKTSLLPTKLFARNFNVDSINQQELAKIEGPGKIFVMENRGFSKLVETLQRSCLALEELELKIGAEVMFVKNNIEGRYVNGTRGVVEGFDSIDGYPIVRSFDGSLIIARPEEWKLEEDGIVRATISQVPLRLAWAITIHKSQGMTLDAVELDLSDAFEPGMGYVALSRVRSLAGLKLLGLNDIALKVHPQILSDDFKFQEWSDLTCDRLKEFSEDEKKKHQETVLFDRFSGNRDKNLVKKKKEDKAKRLVDRSTGKKTPTHKITAEFLSKKKSVKKIAEERGLTVGTIVTHMEKLLGEGNLPDVSYIKKDIKGFDKILKEFKKSKDGKLSPIFDKFDEKYSFETLRLVRLFV